MGLPMSPIQKVHLMSVTEEQARENLKSLIDDYYKLALSQDALASASESDVLVFIERLFRNVLGWPTEDITKYGREKSVVNRRRVDRILNLDDGDKIFIEAKRFGLIGRLSDDWTVRPGQMALPGMATDRTPEEQQAINYAFENNGTWAVLTNFERFRLFNARRDWLVFSFEAPRAYKEDFELLWQLSWDNMHKGSLETLSSQRWTKEVDTDYLAFINEQREQLAIDITLNRGQNPWAYADDGRLRLNLLREVVQRFLDRLVIVRFAEDHYVIPSGTLRRFYELRKENSYYTHELRHYLRDFFRRFDQEHNSALFAPSEVDEAQFSDEVLLPLIDKLYQARFRAMPADIIGNTYEQYLGKTLVDDDGAVTIRDNLETRKKQGSYYTPQYIVRYIVDHSLGRYLYGTYNGRPNGIRIPSETRRTSAEIRGLRVLDSACGSGSFLIYAYQVLAEFYQSEVARLDKCHLKKIKSLARNFADATLDDRIEAQRIEDERDFIRKNYRSLILEKHLYGADLDPQAAEIAVVNLMMRALERKGQDKRLPLILNQNIKVGNSLIGLHPDDRRLADHADSLAAIRRLRAELIDTSNLDPRHQDILAELRAATESLYHRFHQDYAERFEDPARVRPFHWAVEFPEVFVDEHGRPLDNPGFHFIFGNPPYSAKLSQAERDYHKREFKIGTTNTAALFMIQALNLLRDGAVHGFIVPKSFLYASNWRSPRERLLDGLEILADCGKVWDEVMLEQVIYLHKNGAETPTYQNLKREDLRFKKVGAIDKWECRQFGFFVNGLVSSELQIAHQLLKYRDFLGDYITNTRGAGLQSELNESKRGSIVIAGTNVQKYHLRGNKGYYDLAFIPDNAVIKAGNLLVQNIVTRLSKPVPYIRIAAHLVQEDESDWLILDTVNQIEVTSDELSPYFVLALLNSKLINWYVYRFIYAKAVMTMHFDNPVTKRIPLPNAAEQSDLCAEAIAEVKRIYANRHANEAAAQSRIDQIIFRLYGLSPAQIALVEKNMP